MSKYLKIVLLAVLFFAGGFLLGSGYQQFPTPTPATNVVAEKRPISFLLVYDDKKLQTADLTWREDLNVLEATKEVAAQEKIAFDSKDYESIGVLVTQIGDKKNGTNGMYWQYWVNNQQVQISADKYIVKQGDVINWQFRESAF